MKLNSTFFLNPKRTVPPLMLFLAFVLVLNTPLWAQTKYEKEIRLQESKVPQAAQSFMTALPFNKKIKWYQEFGLDKTSVEAKTRYLGKKYSIEFTPEGVLEDVEVKIGKDEIPIETLTKIEAYLTQRFGKYRVRKIQVQYVGVERDVLSFLKNTGSQGVTTNYEWVISAKVDQSYKAFEFLFSQEGSYLLSAEIVPKNTNNIEY